MACNGHQAIKEKKPLVKAIDFLAIWLTQGWGKNRGRALQIIGETGVEMRLGFQQPCVLKNIIHVVNYDVDHARSNKLLLIIEPKTTKPIVRRFPTQFFQRARSEAVFTI